MMVPKVPVDVPPDCVKATVPLTGLLLTSRSVAVIVEFVPEVTVEFDVVNDELEA